MERPTGDRVLCSGGFRRCHDRLRLAWPCRTGAAIAGGTAGQGLRQQ